MSSSSREGYDLFHKYGRQAIYRYIKHNQYVLQLILQDTILTRFNRVIGCKMFGHRNLKVTDCGQVFCFNCNRPFKEDNDEMS